MTLCALLRIEITFQDFSKKLIVSKGRKIMSSQSSEVVCRVRLNQHHLGEVIHKETWNGYTTPSYFLSSREFGQRTKNNIYLSAR